MKELAQVKIESCVKATIYGLLLVGIFYTSHRVMVAWWENEDYNYCYLIVPIVLYLIWDKREELAKVPAQPTWLGLMPLAFGIFLFWLGELGGEFTTMYFASWFVLAGLLLLHLGWPKLKVIWFPIVFLIAMFPPPRFFQVNLTFRLKLISSQLGVWVMQAYGLSAYREGNIIDLGFTQLQVVDACSGLRYLFPLLIMGILLAYFYRAAFWKRAVLVLSTIPLTILTNSLRIAMTGVLYEFWGRAVAEDFFHGFSGWLIFIFGMAVLIVEIWALKRIAPRPGESFFPRPEATQPVEGKIEGRSMSMNWKALFAPPQFIVAILMLAATLAAAQSIEFREKIPISKSFDHFPLEVNAWNGKRDVMEEKFLKELDPSDYLIVDYVNSLRSINFYTAYYESQRKGKSIHSPETCLPGGGWEFKQAGRVTVALQGPRREVTVNRAIMEKSGYRQLSYFWFPMRGRILTNAWEMKLYTFWDALTRQRTDGALVRLITPIYGNEGVAAADERLQSFTRDILPILDQFIPN